MKKILFLLLSYILFAPLACFASEITIETKYFEHNNKIYLQIDLDLPKNSYTYAPNYKAYPTSFHLENLLIASHSTLYYPIEETSFDPLTNKNLSLYKNKIQYFIAFNKENYNYSAPSHILDISLLLCTSNNCTPYKNKISLPKLNKEIQIDTLSNSTFNKLSTEYKEINIQNNNIKDTNSSTSNIKFDFIPTVYNNTVEVTNYFLAILLGFIAGFILNFMPCVLPVIAIKFASIMQIASNNLEDSRKEIRSYSIFYSLGIISLFIILALSVGIFDMLWGQIFQNVYFIILLSGLIFMFALSLLGFFYFPLFNIQIKSKKYPQLESYLQGFLASLIATPCSGPLLGGVLAFSLTLPIHLLITVFISTGLGMSFPYILLFFFPNLIKYIPKTGAWTQVLEKILGYIFLILCIYLLSLLPNSLLYKAIIYIFFVYFFISIYNMLSKRKNHVLYAILIFCIHSLCSYTLLHTSSDNKEIWEEYSYAEFTNYLGQERLLINFTASWCPTCKVIENTSLKDKNIIPLAKEYNLKLIKVDMTEENHIHTELLKSLDSNSIPLLAIFPENIKAYSPIILRDIFTHKQLKNALKDNF